jgi:putative IMPACT (imprinted ancient) family translation regulator
VLLPLSKWAYRVREKIVNPSTGAETVILKHDNDDDGEDAAGGRLAMLLDVRGEDGVIVVVSRWFGGVKLGPRRFAIIANLARELLDHCKTERSK